MIKLSTQYPNVIAPSASYPYGSYKNATSPGALDGTPVDKDWADDDLGWKYAILAAAGIVPDETVDTALVSQFFDALVQVFQGSTPKTGGGVLQSYGTNELQDGNTYILPAANSLPANSVVIVELPDKFSSFTPLIQVDDIITETITNSVGSDTEIIFNEGSRSARFITDGSTAWRV